MKKSASLSCLLLACPLLASALSITSASFAQDRADDGLHVIKSSVNADQDNAEFCLEFDKPLATASPARLASALKLDSDGKSVMPPNIVATASSLCLFPLDRGKAYHLTLSGLRGVDDEKRTAAYTTAFTIPDRAPQLTFTGRNGSINGFSRYDSPLTLRAVNVAQASVTLYRIADVAALMHAWQDRAQTAVAPSESATFARTKGQQVWQNDHFLNASSGKANITLDQKMSLQDRLRDLAPGLYLIVADATDNDSAAKPASKGLAPLTAAWFTKSDFTLRALRDASGIHVFATATNAEPLAKNGLRLIAMNRKGEQVAEGKAGADGTGVIAYPEGVDARDLSTIIGLDTAGNVAFADVSALPQLSGLPALGTIHSDSLFVAPGRPVDLTLSLSHDHASGFVASSHLHVLRGDSLYTDIAVPPLTAGSAKISLIAPPAKGAWSLRWQKDDGSVLAEAPLRVTANAEAPRLIVTSDRDELNADAPWNITIKSVSDSGNPAPLAEGLVVIDWQRLDPAAFGWKDYQFGTPTPVLNTQRPAVGFTTNLEGEAPLRLSLPKLPPDPGLYQAALTTLTGPDAGFEESAPLILPLKPDQTVIGIKALATDARFSQNGLARFALIDIGTDGKAHDSAGLSYQIYEQGRSFAWFQDEGRWNYKPEPQLRPIGGGPLAIKGDGGSVLEWPVTAGNYRLVILDAAGRKMAETEFSAGWESADAPPNAVAAPLALALPKSLQRDHEVTVHFTLPDAAMVTAIIADDHIRKTIHELRPKGDNTLSFTPADDWQNGVSVTLDATLHDPQSAPLHGQATASIAASQQATASDAPQAKTVLMPMEPPAALILRSGNDATLTFALQNVSDASETYRYAFTASPGLKIAQGDSGTVVLASKRSRALSLGLSGEIAGVKEIAVDIAGTHAPHMQRSWPVVVLSKNNFLRSDATQSITPQQPLFATVVKPHQPAEQTPALAFVSRRPMDGLAEILAYAFNAHPFTTAELAQGVEALRLWGDAIAQSGFAPDISVTAKREKWLMQLGQHQNADGSFAPLRGGDGTMIDTAAALTALAQDTSPLVAPAKKLALDWIKQRLSNTWFDEKERAPRAAAYAALAAAGAIDPASLHYFSDTSATTELPAIAEAQVAAAFKSIRDPAAAAFWIKKMLDENKGDKSIDLLSALAATDALSSDDVHAAMVGMTAQLRAGIAPGIASAAALLRAIASDNASAGEWRMLSENQTRALSGVWVARLSDAATLASRNGSDQALSVTYVAQEERPPSIQPQGSNIVRHIYRLNGVELPPQSRPVHGEAYIVELKGTTPAIGEHEEILLHDGTTSALRPIGCPLPANSEAPSFMPWFTTHDLTPIGACEVLPHELNVVLAPNEEGTNALSIVYFAHIDAESVSAIAPPRIRVLK